MTKIKLYCYVDETGQDTKGKLFIVSVVIAKEDKVEVVQVLEKIEKESGKGKAKWVRTKKEFKISYIEKVLSSRLFKHKIFYSLSEDTKAYKEITLISIAAAITATKEEQNYKASVFIDGLYKSEIPRVGAGLRKIGIHTEKVRGVKDENDAIIRLADAISGLIREDFEGNTHAKRLCKKGIKGKILMQV